MAYFMCQYHLQCVDLEQKPRNWVCAACEASGGTRSDVQAWALSPRPAQAGPLKPSRAQALMTAYQGSGLRLGLVKP